MMILNVTDLCINAQMIDIDFNTLEQTITNVNKDLVKEPMCKKS